MKTLNLYRIWEVLNIISEKEETLYDKEIYPYILGNSSSYSEMDFESFLEYYCFRITEDKIIIFNDDRIPYEDWTNNDFSDIPKKLLDMDNKSINEWVDKEIEAHIKQQEENKKVEKEKLQIEIKRLTQRLERL